MQHIPSTEGPQVRERKPIIFDGTAAPVRAVVEQLQANERVAEHTGHNEFADADFIADRLVERGVKLTTADRLVIADTLTQLR